MKYGIPEYAAVTIVHEQPLVRDAQLDTSTFVIANPKDAPQTGHIITYGGDRADPTAIIKTLFPSRPSDHLAQIDVRNAAQGVIYPRRWTNGVNNQLVDAPLRREDLYTYYREFTGANNETFYGIFSCQNREFVSLSAHGRLGRGYRQEKE